MEKSIQQEIQVQLERLNLASTDNDYGVGGGIDVDFDFDSSDEVKVCDSQVCESYDAFKLFEVLEKAVTMDAEDFWNVAESL